MEASRKLRIQKLKNFSIFRQILLDKVKEDKIHAPYSTNGGNEKQKCVVGRPDGFEGQFLREMTKIYRQTKDF